MDESELNSTFHPNPGAFHPNPGGGGGGRLELLLNLFPKPGGAVEAEGAYVDEGYTLELILFTLLLPSIFTPLVPIHSCNLLRPGEGSLCKTESLSK
mgnify:CR=1 FL=1